ncbi:MAG: nucleotidyltransferase family protein [Acidimicrobiia bacterium]
MSRIVSLVLAARPAVAMPAAPWLAPWGTSTLIDHVLRGVRAWPVEPGIVVLGADAEAVLEGADLAGFTVVIDPEWEEGRAAPLRAGVDELTRQTDITSFVLTAADIPGIGADVVGDLVAAHATHDRAVTVPMYRYARGRPLIVRRDLWPRLLGLEDDAGIDALLQTHPSWVEELRVDALAPRTIATPDDLVEMRPRH